MEDGDGGCIATCTLTGAIVLLTPPEKAELEAGDPSKLKKLTAEQFSDCIDMGFLVPDDLDETAYLSYLMNRDRLSPHKLTTYVAFSTECNFKCVYCYEAGQVTHQTMSTATLDKLLKWYEGKLKDGNFSVCSVHLYGGEPLLCYPQILYLLRGLKKITGSLNKKLSARLVTNGYLLTPNIVEELVPLGLDEVHVTLDGPPGTHNQRRPLQDGSGTFEKVLGNLVAVAQVGLPFDIVCRISFDSSNAKEIPALLDLIREYDRSRRIEPYFGHVTQTISQINNPESFCSQNVLQSEEIANNLIYLYSESKKRGFDIPDLYTLGPCMIFADGGVVIAPGGEMYKCLDMIGCSDLVVGNLHDKEYHPLYFEFMEAPQLKECLNSDCPFVPVCGGGCIMQSYLATNNVKGLVCRRNMLEKIYRALLPLKFSKGR